MPPTKKQNPRQSSRLARIDPRMAARMTGMSELSPGSRASRTMKSTISTMPPRKVSRMIPTSELATCAIEKRENALT